MNVLPINNINTRKPVFKSCFRLYNPKTIKNVDCFGKDFVRTTTKLYREDLDWNTFIKYIQYNFADKEKVNVYSLASSDGSEAYSFAISVLDKIPKNKQSKFLPVYASDIDKEVIKSAQKRRINLDKIEIFRAENYYGVNLHKYIEKPGVSVFIKGDGMSDTDYLSSYELKDNVKKAVKFKISDILKELNNIKDDGNTIVMCRNVFPYLNAEYTEKVLDAAKNKLKHGSLFIIGDYDLMAKIDYMMPENGFFKPFYNGSIIEGNTIYQRGYHI